MGARATTRPPALLGGCHDILITSPMDSGSGSTPRHQLPRGTGDPRCPVCPMAILAAGWPLLRPLVTAWGPRCGRVSMVLVPRRYCQMVAYMCARRRTYPSIEIT